MFDTHSHTGRASSASGSAAPLSGGVLPASRSGAPYPARFGSPPKVEQLVPARVVLISLSAAASLGMLAGAGLVVGMGIL